MKKALATVMLALSISGILAGETNLTKKLLAVLFVALGASGVFAVAPSASADPLIQYDLEGAIDPDNVGASEHLACVNPHIEIFGNVLLEDPICV